MSVMYATHRFQTASLSRICTINFKNIDIMKFIKLTKFGEIVPIWNILNIRTLLWDNLYISVHDMARLLSNNVAEYLTEKMAIKELCFTSFYSTRNNKVNSFIWSSSGENHVFSLHGLVMMPISSKLTLAMLVMKLVSTRFSSL